MPVVNTEIRVRITQTKTLRAKNRVREHGDTFKLVKNESPSGILCESFGEKPWLGWFFDDEAKWEIIQ